ncbi:MAG: HAMP domain-containing histidine kinase [Sphingomonadales bacterium]|nr:HAMP domain-containing histidine kinase [Sphingomonadales bacterium]
MSVLVWVALGIGGIWFSATHLFAKHVAEQYHEELEVHIAELASLTQFPGEGGIRLARPLSDPRYMVPLSGFYWQISVEGGGRIVSPSMIRGHFDPEIAHAQWIDHDFEPGPTGQAIAYGMTRTTPAGRTAHFVIATDRKLLEDTIARFSRELSQWLIALGFALIVTGLAVVRFGLRPLDRLAASVSRMREGSVERLTDRYPAEVLPLVEELNDFIASNRETLERARLQAGNLAHALRTPLAVITDEAERLATRDDARQAAEQMLAQATAMVQQIDYHLARARTAAGMRLPGTVSVLPDLVEPLLSAMRKLYPEVSWQIRATPDFRAELPIDPVDLSEILSNLLDNAGKWADQQVDVLLERHLDAVTLSVADDGPGMRDDEIASACEIGQRFDPARSGSGLGLAIVRDIAKAWKLDLAICRQDTGGLKTSLTFNAADN